MLSQGSGKGHLFFFFLTLIMTAKGIALSVFSSI